MCSDAHHSGIIDRIEDDVVVVLLDPDEREITAPVHRLPAKTAEGTAVHVVSYGNTFEIIVNPERTATHRQSVHDKMAELRARTRRR